MRSMKFYIHVRKFLHPNLFLETAMKLKMMSFALLSLLYSAAYSVENCVDWQTHRELTWDDFQGEVTENSPYAAMSYWYIYYRWEGNKVRAESCFQTSKAWIRDGKQSDYLLEHEQLHFDIAQLHIRLFQNKLKSATSTAQVKKLFDESLRAAKQMQARYDEETEHSRNKAEQKRWNRWVAEQLDNYEFYRVVAINERSAPKPPRPPLKGFDISGVWETEYGTLTLKQRGQEVSGAYEYLDDDDDKVRGTVRGTLSQRTLKGTWQEGEDSGTLQLRFSEDGLSFTGEWEEEDGSGEWSGERQ